MQSDKKILIAFILNLVFSIFEYIGGVITGSVAIMSDSIHDLGDALSIGLSYILEKKSKGKPNEQYTYGYTRYSVLGGVVTTMILLFGSILVIYNAIHRIIIPTEINYDGMIGLAIVGVGVNFLAAYCTHDGTSLNQRAVNLHMLEDVLGWIVVLIGAIVMKFTDFSLLDPIMSICVATFILINAVKTLKEAIDLFLEKAPDGIEVSKIREHLLKMEDVIDVHHIHVWSIDGQNNYATMHIVTNDWTHEFKDKVRDDLREFGIGHTTLELEREGENCSDDSCHMADNFHVYHHHHHHHH